MEINPFELDETTPLSLQLSSAQLYNLHYALIKYITQSSHIFEANEVSVWTDFYNIHSEFEHEQHYDDETLRDEFIHHVLPTVHTYELTRVEQTSLKLLELHPFYTRTPQGFLLLPASEQPLSCRQPAVNRDFRIVAQTNAENMFTSKMPTNANDGFSLDAAAVVLGEDHHTLAVPETLQHFESEASPLTSAMLSAMFASDLELASSVVLQPSEVRTRLNDAKRCFEQSGRMLPHVQSHQQFLDKLRNIVKTRQAIENIINSKYN